jgi:7-cyano-7-deazaguanine synthase
MRAALVLFSGGQDSTTCLAWALANFDRVDTVGFDYRQRHAAELDARPRILGAMRNLSPKWASGLGDDVVLPIDTLAAIGGNALTTIGTKFETGPNNLPTSFVPGRNIVFLSAAAALGYRRGVIDLVGGMCETDYSGYPDCRDATIKSAAQTLSLALDAPLRIHTPLMRLDKASTWALAEELGGRALVDLIIEETVTCYEGNREVRHSWGYGCGRCPACDLRAKGFANYDRKP